MDPFLPYSIPIRGLKIGLHRYQYLLDDAFFRHFESSPIEDAEVSVQLQLDKRSDMLVLDFQFDGYRRAECDRCTADIRLPIRGERQLVVKYGDAEGETEDEVVFITRETPELNVARYLYEFAVLALPITNTYDCESDPNPPCNREVLKFLETNSEAHKPDVVWDALKDLK